MHIKTNAREFEAGFTLHYCRKPNCLNIRAKNELFCGECLSKNKKQSKEKQLLSKNRGKCWIYFIEMEGHDFIKIGKARDIEKRAKTLQIGTPYKINVLAKFYTFQQVEKCLHDLFSEYNERGEWFRKNPELLFLIEAIKSKHVPIYIEAFEQDIISEILS